MSGSDTALYNQAYNSIDRPFANVDFSKIPSWDIVMSIMEQQAVEARRQMMAKYQSQAEQMMPQSIANYEYRSAPFNYAGNTSTEESDNSSYCSSDDVMSSSPPSSPSDLSQSESDSDIEIDVDSIEDDCEDYFIPSMDNIPTTVLQLETRLRERERNQS
jgi:hypothetical protein